MATYTVATPKGGVGKSTTAAELVLALSAPRMRGSRQVMRLTLSWAGPEVRAPGPTTETTQDLAESSPSAAQCPRC